MRKEINLSEQTTLHEQLAGLERSLSRAKTEYGKKAILAQMECIQQQLADQSQLQSGAVVETPEQATARLLGLATMYVEVDPQVAVPDNKVTFRSIAYANKYVSGKETTSDISEKTSSALPQVVTPTHTEPAKVEKKTETPQHVPARKKIVLKTKEKKPLSVTESTSPTIDESTWQALALIFHSLRIKYPQVVEDFFWALGESSSETQTMNLLREYSSFLGQSASVKIGAILQAYWDEKLSYEEIRKRFFHLKG